MEGTAGMFKTGGMFKTCKYEGREGRLGRRGEEGFGNCSASDVEWRKDAHGEGAVGVLSWWPLRGSSCKTTLGKVL